MSLISLCVVLYFVAFNFSKSTYSLEFQLRSDFSLVYNSLVPQTRLITGGVSFMINSNLDLFKLILLILFINFLKRTTKAGSLKTHGDIPPPPGDIPRVHYLYSAQRHSLSWFLKISWDRRIYSQRQGGQAHE